MQFATYHVVKVGRRWCLDLHKDNDKRRYTEAQDGGYYFGYPGHQHCVRYATQKDAETQGKLLCGRP